MTATSTALPVGASTITRALWRRSTRARNARREVVLPAPAGALNGATNWGLTAIADTAAYCWSVSQILDVGGQ